MRMPKGMMKRMVVGILALVILSPQVFSGEKEKLHWMTFDEGIATAKKNNKKVLIDVYTDWCGWCKKMDKDTYTEDRVSDYLGENYVVIKLNAESPKKLSFQGKSYTEQELAGAFGVTGYPTTIFLSSGGDPITLVPGYSDAKRFSDIISFIAEDHYLTTKFDDYVANRK
jgi:thioredoxin-related protein